MMARQTFKGPVHWIVVDDGHVPVDVELERDGWRVTVVRPATLWQIGDNTQGRNLIAGLEVADDLQHALVAIVEDDDWYHEGWLQFLVDHAHEAELIGECDAVYYNVASRKWQRLHNGEHASLRCTAMSGDAIETFKVVLETPHKYYDQKLWARHKSKKVYQREFTVGMKGLPGRPGIALGHDRTRGNSDPDLAFLRDLIGQDADWYCKFLENEEMAKKQPIVLKAFRYARKDYKPGDVFEAKSRIDVELHVHAKKVALRDVVSKQASKPKRSVQTGNQEQKLYEQIIERAASDDVETASDIDESQQDETDTSSEASFGFKRRGRKAKAD